LNHKNNYVEIELMLELVARISKFFCSIAYYF